MKWKASSRHGQARLERLKKPVGGTNSRCTGFAFSRMMGSPVLVAHLPAEGGGQVVSLPGFSIARAGKVSSGSLPCMRFSNTKNNNNNLIK